MIITEKVNIKGNGRNLRHYRRKGYDIEINQIIEVNVNDLPNMSMVKVIVKCDSCSKEKNIMYKSYYRNIKKYGFYTCHGKCSMEKTKMTNKENLGVEYPTQYKNTIKKRKENNIKKYGVDEPSKIEEIHKKVKKTKKEKYGNENYNNIEKIKKTKNEKYGNENYNNRSKSKDTCLIKYNVEKF